MKREELNVMDCGANFISENIAQLRQIFRLPCDEGTNYKIFFSEFALIALDTHLLRSRIEECGRVKERVGESAT